MTLAFITAREDPMLPMLLDSLEPQLRPGDEISLLVIDALSRTRAELGCAASRRLAHFDVEAPKPNVWQGRHRVTPHDFFANANARNTAIGYCRTEYIAFIDDRARLESQWLEVVRTGERERASVLCGPYDKHEDTHLSIDHRRQHAPRGKRDCSGSWAFGGNFALPLEWLLEVNGCEEGCDPTGAEDYILGLMLQNAGHRLDFVVEMSIQQDRHGDVHPAAYPRLDKGISPDDRSHAINRRFGVRSHTEFTPNLRELRAHLGAGESWPIPDTAFPHRDWYDRGLISEMTCH